MSCAWDNRLLHVWDARAFLARFIALYLAQSIVNPRRLHGKECVTCRKLIRLFVVQTPFRLMDGERVSYFDRQWLLTHLGKNQ